MGRNQRIITVCLVLLLGGCISAEQTRQTFNPFVAEVKDKAQLDKDEKTCRLIAVDYLKKNGGLDSKQIGQSGIEGVLNSLSAYTSSMVAPGLGGAGSAGGEALKELGYNSEGVKKVLTVCLHDKGLTSNAYHVYDPNL